MPTFSGKTFNSYFKNLLGVDRATNAGIDENTRRIQDGLGDNTALSLSDDSAEIKPNTDATTNTFDVKDLGGNSILTVDTQNSRVKCGSSQVNAMTMYKEFNSYGVTPNAGYHFVLFPGTSIFGSTTNLNEYNLGNGTDPATTLDVSAETLDTYELVPSFWYLPDAITIMSAHVLMGVSGASDHILNFHLTSYAIDTSSNFGDLSDGTVVADSGTTSAVDEDVIKYDTMTNLPTDVAAGRVILATVESTHTSALSITLVVKYHIQ